MELYEKIKTKIFKDFLELILLSTLLDISLLSSELLLFNRSDVEDYDEFLSCMSLRLVISAVKLQTFLKVLTILHYFY